MANVYYCCPFVPTELVVACGHIPLRSRVAAQTPTSAAETEGLCAWAAAFVQTLTQQTDVGAVIFTTACDQMRRVFELYTERSKRPAFLLNIPKTSGPTAMALLAGEFNRFARFLANLDGGKKGHDNLQQFLNTLNPQKRVPVHDGLAVIGGPLFDFDLDRLSQVIKQFRLKICFDGTEPGWRHYRLPCDETAKNTSPLEMLAQSYLSTPAIWKRPGLPFFEWLTVQIKMCHAVGVIIIQHPFCDYWRAAAHDIKCRLSIPVVTVETGEGGCFSSAALSRLEAFLEQCAQ